MKIIAVTSNEKRTLDIINKNADEHQWEITGIRAVDVDDSHPLTTEEDFSDRVVSKVDKILKILEDFEERTAIILDIRDAPIMTFIYFYLQKLIYVTPSPKIIEMSGRYFVDIAVVINDTDIIID